MQCMEEHALSRPDVSATTKCGQKSNLSKGYPKMQAG